MSLSHPSLATRDNYPEDARKALLAVVRDAGGTGITLDELVNSKWFGTRSEVEELVERYTAYNILDTINSDSPGEKRTIVFPDQRLLDSSAGDLQFAVNTLFTSS